MRCPNCRERIARDKDDGLLIISRHIFIKSDSVTIKCKRCRTLVTVKPTLLKVKPSAD